MRGKEIGNDRLRLDIAVGERHLRLITHMNHLVKLTSHVFRHTSGTDIGRPVRYLPRPFEIAHRAFRGHGSLGNVLTLSTLRVMAVSFPKGERLEKRTEGKHVEIEMVELAIES